MADYRTILILLIDFWTSGAQWTICFRFPLQAFTQIQELCQMLGNPFLWQNLTWVTDWIARNSSVGECVDRSSHRSVVGSNLSPLIPHAGDHAATTRCNHRSSLTTSKCKWWRPSIISAHKCATTHITVQKHLVWDETFPQFLSWIQIPANLFSAFHIHRFTCKTCSWHLLAH